MERLEKLKVAYLLNKESEETLRELLCLLEQSLKKIIKKREFNLSTLERDEIIQFTLLNILEHIDQIESIGAYSQITLRNIYLRFDSRRQRKATFIEKGHFDVPAPSSDLFRDRFKDLPAQMEARLRKIIKSMSSPNSDVLKARYLEGLSHKEMAKKLRIPTNHIGMYIRRAEKRFMKKLKNDNQMFYKKLAEHFGKEI